MVTVASVGMLAAGDGAIPKAGNKGAAGSSGATKPSSQRKRQATASLSSRNEHARSKASSTGVEVRGDAARVLVPADFGCISSIHHPALRRIGLRIANKESIKTSCFQDR